MEQSVSGATRLCWEAFEQCSRSLNESREHDLQTLDLKDEFEVFRAWVRASGAYGEDHASLDYRLRENLPTRRLFITILEDLSLGLSRCAILSRPNPGATPSDSASSVEVLERPTTPDFPSDSESHSDNSVHVPSVEDFLNDISGSVDKLVQISRAIKNSSTSNWSIKAEAYEEWEDELGVLINKSERFKVFVGILLEHRYRDLHVDVRNRLRESISRCHRRIAYQKKCQPKLSYEGAKMVTENQGRSVAMLSVLPTPGSKAAQQLIQLATAPTAPIAQSQRGSYMSASTLSPEFNPFGSENRSSVSSGSSYSRLQANQEEELPPPPPLKGNQRYFQCPYCFIQLPRKRAKRRAWIKHLVSDLQPYVCVFDECHSASHRFENEDEWIRHERWQHNLSWSCDGFDSHPPSTFYNGEEFQLHFGACHSGLFSPPQIEKLVLVSATPVDICFGHCPFCDFAISKEQALVTDKRSTKSDKEQDDYLLELEQSQRSMQRHILNHLLALFQLALPPRIDLPDDVSLENSSRVDAETTRDALDVDFDMIDSEYFDQEYTTPLGSIQESIREASSDDLPLAQRDSYGGPTTDYILKGFVKDKLIFEIPHEISLLRPLVTNATLAMIDVVTMVSKALGSLIQPDEDQNRIALEIDLLFDALKDFHNCSNEFLVGARKNLGSLFTSPTLEDSSISLMSRLHGTLWALACNLGLVSRREQIGNKYNMETFQVFISTVQRSRVHISRLLTGDESELKSCLDSLWFPEVVSRQEGIADAHQQTFQWLFDDSDHAVRPWSNFGEWLKTGQGLFWVSGKPGSGKSTLMKYICNDARTKELLEVWAGTEVPKVVTPKFFFSSSGSPMQKSSVGLLRSLLYQIFRECPEFASLPERNEPLPIWTEARLVKTFQSVTKKSPTSYPMCFFIDGLDEFSGDHDLLITLFRELVQDANIKVVLSSRPSVAFVEAFGSGALLRLQDLTRLDIEKFVSDNLLSMQAQTGLEVSEDINSDIIHDIVWKSEGVFLWAKLVVRDQMKGYKNGDDPEQLKERLTLLPENLEEVYARMLGMIEKVHRKEAAWFLELALYEDSNTLLDFTLAVYDRLDHDLGSSADFPSQNVINQCQTTRARITTTCVGLLEVHEQPPGSESESTTLPEDRVTVKFLHQTVANFLEGSKQGRTFLDNNTTPSRNAREVWAKVRAAKHRMIWLSAGA